MSLLARFFPDRARGRGAEALRAAAADCLNIEARVLLETWADLVEGLSPADVREAMRSSPVEPTGYVVQDGVAIVPISGPMLGQRSEFLDWIGADYTVTPEAAAAVRAAAEDPAVEQLALLVDSPGGQVRGVRDFADAVAEFPRPSTSYALGTMASAAYWPSARADRVVALRDAVVGSIGVLATVDDSSALMARIGIQRHLIATGPLKGAGTPGVRVTEAALEQVRAMVDHHFADFLGAVGAGRGLEGEALAAVSTGGVWMAARAQELGLVDDVVSSIQISNNKGDQPINHPAPNGATEGTMTTMTTPAAPAAEDLIAANRALNAELTEAKQREAEAEARAQAAEAKAEMLAARLGSVKDDAITAILDKHCGTKFAAAQRPEWEARARKAFSDDPKGLDAFFIDLPDLLHTKPAGASAERPAPAAADKPDRFGLTAADYALSDNVVEISLVRREATTKDGQRVQLGKKEGA